MDDTEIRDDTARLHGGDTLVISRWLPGPAERIWRYLTDAELRRLWLADGVMVPRAGAPLELIWRNDGLSSPGDPRPEGFAEEQRMTSRVIAFDPPHRLVIAWGASGEVAFDLLPRGDRVLLRITHSGLGDPAPRSMIAAGWHSHLDILRARLDGGAAPSFWGHWAGLRAEYDRQFSG